MANDGYLLSAKALRDIKRMKETVQRLNSRVNRMGVSGPREGNRVFAKITGSDSTSYSGVQVYYNGTGWTTITNGISWTAGGVSELREINGLTTVANDTIVPVDSISDGTTVWWGFRVVADEMTDTISGHIEEPAAKTYYLDLDVYTDGTIDELTTQATDNTCAAVIKINGTNVTFATSPTFDTTEATFDATALNEFSEGDTLSMVLSSVDAACVDARFSLRFTRSIP